ncbi:hypothetical protein [Flavobacterium sp. CF136]|uniref:hypothetical protein n=1 Tax=Flavobacterium sp. (strain CF136) TaxID=1144313 RepID=UPI0002D824BF|nr:hypothetical protein [Flavobacterium sp. CF136]
MKNFTIKDYKLVIKNRFEIIQEEGLILDLIDPSPAKLRNLCVDIFAKGLTKNDENIFVSFFEAKENSKLKMAIENCNVDRFKSIISILRGTNSTDDRKRIEIAAILVDQKPRPFSKFMKGETEMPLFENEEDHENDEILNREKINCTETEKSNSNQDERSEEIKDKVDKENKIPKGFIGTAPKITNKKHIVLLVGIFALIGGFIMWNFKNEGDCMVWKKDHYEAVSCDIVSNKMSLMTPIVTKKEENIISNFKKIKVCDTTSFFKLGKPCVWYGKSADGNYDCFTAPGLHPETGITLKPITQYMISKHILKKKK